MAAFYVLIPILVAFGALPWPSLVAFGAVRHYSPRHALVLELIALAGFLFFSIVWLVVAVATPAPVVVADVARIQARLSAVTEGQPLDGAEEPKLSAPPTPRRATSRKSSRRPATSAEDQRTDHLFDMEAAS